MNQNRSKRHCWREIIDRVSTSPRDAAVRSIEYYRHRMLKDDQEFYQSIGYNQRDMNRTTTAIAAGSTTHEEILYRTAKGKYSSRAYLFRPSSFVPRADR